MALYDEYLPDPPLLCPGCGALLDGWQGKDGPCALLIWQQGKGAPIGQRVDDDYKFSAERLVQSVLPERFEYYTSCSMCRREVDMTGFSVGDIWRQRAFGRHRIGEPVPAARLVDAWRQCGTCAEAWEEEPSRSLSECPYCKALTALVGDPLGAVRANKEF